MTGIEHELEFWKSFVQTDRFLQGWCTKSKTPELSDIVYQFIKTQPQAKVLDCGSGACSILTGTVPNENLTACDLLGDQYATIFDYVKHDVVPPQPIACEDLPFEEEFDIVLISNALDHTQNPIKSYDRLLNAVKHGGYLIIQTFENEGLHENWQGLHQWNLSLEDNKLKITAKDGRVWVKDGAVLATTERVPTLPRKWLIFIVQK